MNILKNILYFTFMIIFGIPTLTAIFVILFSIIDNKIKNIINKHKGEK